MTAVRPLHPLARPLPPSTDRRHRIAEGEMFLAPAAITTAALVHEAITRSQGRWPAGWTFAHDRAGAPLIAGGGELPPAVSVAATGCMRALLIGAGPLGIDLETLDRIALNARCDDDWLAPAEQVLLGAMPPSERPLELACRWVLREAYGKASGRGLDMALAHLAFTTRAGAVTLSGIEGWTFSLYRRDALVIGIVAAGSGG